MRTQKLESTDGFVIWDLDDAEHAVGVARLAPKILRDGAEMLARSVTYSFAAFSVKASGASAAINAKPDARDEAVTAFVDELHDVAASGALVLRAGNGLHDADLAPLTRAEYASIADDELAAHSAVAACEGFVGSLDGHTVAVFGSGPVADAAAIAAGDKGATVGDGDVGADVDVLFVAGRGGVVTDELAPSVRAKTVVPLTPIPIGARAFAILRAAAITYVPDFVALAAPLLAAFDGDAGEPMERVRETAEQLASHGPDAWLVAVGLAEAFLETWQESPPFGRPLA